MNSPFSFAITEASDWRLDVPCRRGPLRDRLFFPTAGRQCDRRVAAAKRMCASCPLAARQECLRIALANRDDVGIFGGTTGAERRERWPEAFEGRRPSYAPKKGRAA